MDNRENIPLPPTPKPADPRAIVAVTRRQMAWLVAAFCAGLAFGIYLVVRDCKLAGLLVLAHSSASFALFTFANLAPGQRPTGLSGIASHLWLLGALSFAGGAGAGAQLAAGRLPWLGWMAFSVTAVAVHLSQFRLL